MQTENACVKREQFARCSTIAGRHRIVNRNEESSMSTRRIADCRQPRRLLRMSG